MSRPQRYFDWQRIVDEQSDDESPENTRGRLRWLMAGFCLAAVAILARAAQLEITDGENFRRRAAEPIERTVMISPARGRIVARDGTVLAEDRVARAVAVQFRYLENPPDSAWLKRLVRGRLSRSERKDRARVAAMETTVRGELADVRGRLARLCGISDGEWQARAGRIQRRVHLLAARVDRQRLERYQARQARIAVETAGDDLSLTAILGGLFAPPEPLPPPPVIVAEQTAYHRIASDLPAEACREIESHLQDYPGVKIVEYARREYPGNTTAVNVVGHVGGDSGVHFDAPRSAQPGGDGEPAGLMGIERRFDAQLQGKPGNEVQRVDQRGKVLSVVERREAVPGDDVILTIDMPLQLAAESLIDRAVRRLEKQSTESNSTALGGAIVALDVHTGEVLVAASAPRFDPNWFAAGDDRVQGVLSDPRRPQFDRAVRMAIPPGSVFKPLVALALLESGAIDPNTAFRCQGYWEDPDRLRCMLFRQHGIGHGDMTLADALVQSCNVYFFEHAIGLGAAPLVNWSSRFGFGSASGVELPDEAAGQLPVAEQLRELRELQSLAIGQGELTATPLQIARMYAAIANGGYLLTPRLTREQTDSASRHLGHSKSDHPQGARIAELSPASLATVRTALHRVVDDANGTAYATVRLPSVSIAGKTGTAETGGGQQDHAWFAGYVPAESPQVAFVVVLEHGGSGAAVAGMLARGLVQRMQQLGYFGPLKTADMRFPPGKG
jgi:penicillin-binding protein 2